MRHDGVDAEHPTGLRAGARLDGQQVTLLDGETRATHSGVVFIEVMLTTIRMWNLCRK